MLAIERRQKIMAMLNENKSVLVPELAKLFNVTEETIRRDLEKLEKEGLLKRTYGGAVLVENYNVDIPFEFRNVTNIEGKKQIALSLIKYIEDGDTLVMDSSTSALQVAKLLKTKKKITVITNSEQIINELKVFEDTIKVISTGGTLRNKSLSLVGPIAEQTLRSLNANKAIISCKGFDIEKGFTESNELEAQVKKLMIEIADKVYMIADHTKMNKTALVNIATLDDVDFIFTDKILPPSQENAIREKNVEIVYC
ncbi:DeoR family transcriptional regulator [Caldicellulosiruptor bescii]|uniref:Transcriptional regulator, DeoR family n=4 Tax=Caldicellulosiruptoraceae TaxID=3071002 RepID=B9MQK3_CALBD|nr:MULTISPECIES: DeoR/GlpR family DNA-binding transcription regulator [Caldicellulosiruptor]ACM59957.1 transcriptional regulator, DeoR family [Caldicellulosiruptor bescii DSM 6725]PBC87368.1 DeoR family transcriptional regulator [Caldicellulosiruptor bescii]PBC90308.1 DeoR family transcriptional regulator [Caldicellulosiruptor bescii]PBD04264.1 DeoR family transcriptional regulator [Caldicellulosiruptor bescii]PBD06105.1 DeoR family transcriptional regulator [Caldicellulosiruptor bescii]